MTASNPSPQELAGLWTKKIWEKVIGAKFNVNDEVNQIAAHQANVALGMSQVSKITGGKTGKR
jgi:hypothetical protein